MMQSEDLVVFATALTVLGSLFFVCFCAIAIMAWERERLIWLATTSEDEVKAFQKKWLMEKKNNYVVQMTSKTKAATDGHLTPASPDISVSSQPIPAFPRITMPAQLGEVDSTSTDAYRGYARKSKSESLLQAFDICSSNTTQHHMDQKSTTNRTLSNGSIMKKMPSSPELRTMYEKQHHSHPDVRLDDVPRSLRKAAASKNIASGSNRRKSWHVDDQESQTTEKDGWMSYQDEARSMTSEFSSGSQVGFDLRRSVSAPIVLRIDIDEGPIQNPSTQPQLLPKKDEDELLQQNTDKYTFGGSVRKVPHEIAVDVRANPPKILGKTVHKVAEKKLTSSAYTTHISQSVTDLRDAHSVQDGVESRKRAQTSTDPAPIVRKVFKDISSLKRRRASESGWKVVEVTKSTDVRKSHASQGNQIVSNSQTNSHFETEAPRRNKARINTNDDDALRQRLVKAHGRDDIVLVHVTPKHRSSWSPTPARQIQKDSKQVGHHTDAWTSV